jgi:hypothetical protein
MPGHRRTRTRHVLVPAVLILVSVGAAAAADQIRHDLTIELDPVTHMVEVVDRVTLPGGGDAGEIEFLLNGAFTILESTSGLERLPAGDIEGFFSINASPDLVSGLELERYRLEERPAGDVLTISYAGVIDFGLSDQKEEYTRGFRETGGIVSEEGVYLAGNGFWYPFFNDELISFSLDASVPEGWHLISQGNGTSRDEDGRAVWDSGGGVDEIFLVGGPLLLYSDSAGVVDAQVYLRDSDDALAAKYLEATARYIEMYRKLLGPYPYGKFALVENFWETGYGMPSFTLLGPTVIRFPFILNSSYPHEILHNWWGNSVFVDFAGGNWCEGLTAYLADHLIQEQRGTATEYRRTTLQKYRNYVQEGEDFPLTEFRSRHSAATEAIGYGKTLMMFHMLRRQIGEEAFGQGLARFYSQYRGRRASFNDLRTTFETTADTELEGFFAEWVERPGALDLRLEVEPLAQDENGDWVIGGRVIQQQAGEPYGTQIPVVIQYEDGVSVSWAPPGKVQEFNRIHDGKRPLAVHVDPSFDLFRILDPREIPPSIGQIFGDPEILAVLPDAAPEEEVAAYEELFQGWQSESHVIEIVSDGDLESLPSDRSVWIIGRDNRFAGSVTESTDGVTLDEETLTVADESVTLADHSMVVVRRHPDAPEKAVGWLVVEPRAAFPGVGRKLPHYGKYSYLAFEGDEPTNVVKGQWDTTDSPLLVDLRPQEERSQPLPPLELGDRQALAELPPAFSEKSLTEHVSYLASEELAGRVPGSPGAQSAADYIAAAFETIGLVPGGDGDSYLQRFTIDKVPTGGAIETANVIGYLPGTKPGWTDQAVVVSAHYDHLGLGWPDVHQGDEGQIHAGADDNASGVAVLLELARALANSEMPGRSIVFVAFSGEEADRAGSRFFVENPYPVSLAGIQAIINLDTVGRLFDGKVQILGTGTAGRVAAHLPRRQLRHRCRKP